MIGQSLSSNFHHSRIRIKLISATCLQNYHGCRFYPSMWYTSKNLRVVDFKTAAASYEYLFKPFQTQCLTNPTKKDNIILYEITAERDSVVPKLGGLWSPLKQPWHLSLQQQVFLYQPQTWWAPLTYFDSLYNKEALVDHTGEVWSTGDLTERCGWWTQVRLADCFHARRDLAKSPVSLLLRTKNDSHRTLANCWWEGKGWKRGSL